MSYGAAAALQAAIFGRLTGWPALAGVPVFDAVPLGGGSGTFVLIGPEEVQDQSDRTGGGAAHQVEIAVISDATGFAAAKGVAVAVSDALTGFAGPLARGQLVGTRFVKASARRVDEGDVRRIDLIFRARIED